MPVIDNSTLLSGDDNSTMPLNETWSETELDPSNWTYSNVTRVLVEFSSSLALTGLIVPQYVSEVQLLLRSLEFGMADVFSEYLSAGLTVKEVSVLSIHGHSDGKNYTLDPSAGDEDPAEEDHSLIEMESMSMHHEASVSFSMSVAATSLSMHSADPSDLIGQYTDMPAAVTTSRKRHRIHRSNGTSGRRLHAARSWRRKRVNLSVHKSSNSNDNVSDERYDPFLGIGGTRELGTSRWNDVPNHRLFHRTSLGTSLHERHDTLPYGTHDLNEGGASMSMKDGDQAHSHSMSMKDEYTSMSMVFNDIPSLEKVELSMSMEHDYLSMSINQSGDQSQPEDRTDDSSHAPCRHPSIDDNLTFVSMNIVIEWLCERECDFSADLLGLQVLSEATQSILNPRSVQTKLQDYISMQDATVQGVSIDAAVKVMGESFNYDDLGTEFEFEKSEPCVADISEGDGVINIGSSSPALSPSPSPSTSISNSTASPSSSTTSGLTSANSMDSPTNGTSIPTDAPSSLPLAPALELVDFGSEPAAEDLPLFRCQGDCDDDR